MKIKFAIILITMIISETLLSQIPPDAILPIDRRMDWYTAGLTIERPTYYDHIIDVCTEYNLLPNNDDWMGNLDKLNDAIASLRSESGWKMIYFSQPGTYKIGGTIVLSAELGDHNIVFKGIVGFNQVELLFQTTPANLFADMFSLTGQYIQERYILNDWQTLKGQNKIKLDATVTIGNYVDFNYNKLNMMILNMPIYSTVGQNSKITSFDSNTGAYILSDAFAIDHISVFPRKVVEYKPISGIGFEDLKLRRDNFSFPIVIADGNSCNIRFQYATDCWVYGVEIENTLGWHVGITQSSHIWLHGNYIHHSTGYDGGEGYGITFYNRATKCLAENNIFKRLRHSLLLQYGATLNAVLYNYSYDRKCGSIWECDPLDGTGDLSLHGHYPIANLLEGNMVEYLHVDNSHFLNGDYNTIFRNWVGTYPDLGEMEIENIYRMTLIGNEIEWKDEDENVHDKLDIYGISGGLNRTHNYYIDHKSEINSTTYFSDISYYYQNKPAWWMNIYTWPPIGPRVSLNGQYLSQIIPALWRNSQSVKTLTGPIPRTILTFTPGYYPETNSYGGKYSVNGIIKSNYTPTIFESFSILAEPQDSKDGFLRWSDGSTENPRTLIINNPKTLYAVFKKGNYSTDPLAFANNNQRKIIQSNENNVYKAYTAIGYSWLEKSTDNGLNWKMENAPWESGPGKYLGATESKAPSLALHTSLSPMVVFQEKIDLGTEIISKIRLAYMDVYLHKINYLDVDDGYCLASNSIEYALNANPVITYINDKMLVVYRRQDGLYYRYGQFSGTNPVWLGEINCGIVLDYTDENSMNPSLVAKNNNGTPIFYLCWQQGNTAIKYCTLVPDAQNNMVFSTIETPSAGNGYVINIEPSISLISGNPTICWVGTPYQSATTRKVFSRNKSTTSWGTFNIYGNNVYSPTSNNGIITWSESSPNTYPNKMFRWGAIKTIPTFGKHIQVTNGPNPSTMYAVSHRQYTPFDFMTTPNLGSIPKESITKQKQGRESIISVGENSFNFKIGNITADNLDVEFIEIEDSTTQIKIDNLNDIMTTKPFSLNNVNDINLSISYGSADSIYAFKDLNKDAFLEYLIELIDANTGQTISTLMNIVVDRVNVPLNSLRQIKANLNNTFEGNVKLVVKTRINFNANFAIANLYGTEDAINSTSIETINLMNEAPVTTYELKQNYPNPFNPITTINYQIPEDGSVEVKIFDILGNEITTLVNEYKTSGRYQIQFDASILSSGIYIYQIRSGKFNSAKKMILMK